MSQNTAEKAYGSHNDHGGEHKDEQPKSSTGGSSLEKTPANTEDNSAGIKAPPGHDPANQPAFAYTKPASNSLLDKVGKALSGHEPQG